MKAKMLAVLAGLLLLPVVLRADGRPREWCGEPVYWVLHDPAAVSTAADGRTIEILPINDWCWLDCFEIYTQRPWGAPAEGRFRIFEPDGTLSESGTWSGETIRYKYETCPVEISWLFGGRLVYRVNFTASDGTEFTGTMEVRSEGEAWEAIGAVRVWIGSRGLQFDQPTPVRTVFWAA